MIDSALNSIWPAGMQFGSPWALWLLLIPPLLLAMRAWRRPRVVRLSAVDSAWRVPATLRSQLLWVPPMAKCLGLCLLVVALARPRVGAGRVERSTEAVAIQLVVDRSGSMRQGMSLDGVAMSRLDVVKKVVREFLLGESSQGTARSNVELGGRHADLIGLVTFAALAETVCPLVRDPAALVQLTDTVTMEQMQQLSGTSVGGGLALAAARLQTAEQDLKARAKGGKAEDLKLKSKIIILLTDGADNVNSPPPLEAAKLAADWGIKVYTIGIGAGYEYDHGMSIFGRRGGDVDEDSLQKIADMTGGIYRRAQDGEALRKVYAEIDSLEKTTVDTVEYMEFTEHFVPFAASGAAFAALGAVFGVTFLRRTLA